jgi:hypothetical protein
MSVTAMFRHLSQPLTPFRYSICPSCRNCVLDASGGIGSKVSDRPSREALDSIHKTDIALLN